MDKVLEFLWTELIILRDLLSLSILPVHVAYKSTTLFFILSVHHLSRILILFEYHIILWQTQKFLHVLEEIFHLSLTTSNLLGYRYFCLGNGFLSHLLSLGHSFLGFSFLQFL